MMKSKLFTVIADDLTGACEIAAIGHEHGLDSIVNMGLDGTPTEADLIVYDTETRLDSAVVASAKIRSSAACLREQRNERYIFKKVDSVMRGPIASELNVLAGSLGYQRVILVPANPGLKRTIRNGFYRIDGTPLHLTPFGNDLHHPIKSAWVSDLLGPSPELVVHRASPADTLPADGIITGDAETSDDLVKWAEKWTEDTLLAGSAAFFEVFLREVQPGIPVSLAEPRLSAKCLLVSGTTHPGQQDFLKRLREQGCPACSPGLAALEPKSPVSWAGQTAKLLDEGNLVLLHMNADEEPDPRKSGVVRESLARSCAELLQTGRVNHIIAEGGATAASIAQRMDWRRLRVIHTWAPGIVTLSPVTMENVLFTLKPGSYPWPESIIEAFTRARSSPVA